MQSVGEPDEEQIRGGRRAGRGNDVTPKCNNIAPPRIKHWLPIRSLNAAGLGGLVARAWLRLLRFAVPIAIVTPFCHIALEAMHVQTICEGG